MNKEGRPRRPVTHLLMITAHSIERQISLLTRIRILGFGPKEKRKKDIGDLDMKNFKEEGKSYKNGVIIPMHIWRFNLQSLHPLFRKHYLAPLVKETLGELYQFIEVFSSV